MTVSYALAGLRTGLGQTGAADHVVEAALAEDLQVFTGVALLTLGNRVKFTKLALTDPVGVLDLLFLGERLAVHGFAAAGASHTGSERAAFRRAQRTSAFKNPKNVAFGFVIAFHRETTVNTRFWSYIVSHLRFLS